MQRQPVSSSHIVSVGWEKDDYGSGTLEVEFSSGDVYSYAQVPEREFTALTSAVSVGRYLRASIIGSYTATKL
jgi:hypothetical protein